MFMVLLYLLLNMLGISLAYRYSLGGVNILIELLWVSVSTSGNGANHEQ